MIKSEEKEYYGRILRHTFSDTGFRIRKVGTNEIYDDAVDILGSTATYEETEEKIPVQEEEQ